MIEIKADSANELFVLYSKRLLKEGKIVSPRGKKTIELQDVWLTLNDIKNNVVTLKSRKIDLDYLNAELRWYRSGDLSINKIKEYSKFWTTIANDEGNINSNYGFLSFKDIINGRSQYDWCLEKLCNDKDSRQAIINYNQPKHKYDGNKDFVCTIAQLFRINNNKLDSTVFMRSQDLIYGLTYDMPWFCFVQQKLSDDLGIKPGVYNNFSASLHVYEKHFDMLKNISKEKFKKYNAKN